MRVSGILGLLLENELSSENSNFEKPYESYITGSGDNGGGILRIYCHKLFWGTSRPTDSSHSAAND